MVAECCPMKLNVFDVSKLKPQLLPAVFSRYPKPCRWNWPRSWLLGAAQNAFGVPPRTVQGLRWVKSVTANTSGLRGVSCNPLCPQVTEKFANQVGVSVAL